LNRTTIVAAIACIAVSSSAVADPAPGPSAEQATSPATTPDTPRTGTSEQTTTSTTATLAFAADPEVHPRASIAILGGIYAGFSSWAYLAWYAKHKPLGYFKWGGDGWLGPTTYAGGADKFGHAWATMGLARAGTWILSDYGGFDHLRSSLLSAALAETLFFFVEVKDGFFYEFSFSDLAGDTVGMALGILFDNFPRLDEMFDYRVEYFPSPEYRTNASHGNGLSRLNIAEDYSGETYLLAFHLGSIHALRDQPWGTWSRFVDLTLGFDSRGYKPTPPDGYAPSAHAQNLFIGVSLNAQGLFDWLLEGRPSSTARTTRKITHAVFEMFNLPFTSLSVIQGSRSPSSQVTVDGA
jgi:hypothetical protein